MLLMTTTTMMMMCGLAIETSTASPFQPRKNNSIWPVRPTKDTPGSRRKLLSGAVQWNNSQNATDTESGNSKLDDKKIGFIPFLLHHTTMTLLRVLTISWGVLNFIPNILPLLSSAAGTDKAHAAASLRYHTNITLLRILSIFGGVVTFFLNGLTHQNETAAIFGFVATCCFVVAGILPTRTVVPGFFLAWVPLLLAEVVRVPKPHPGYLVTSVALSAGAGVLLVSPSQNWEQFIAMIVVLSFSKIFGFWNVVAGKCDFQKAFMKVDHEKEAAKQKLLAEYARLCRDERKRRRNPWRRLKEWLKRLFM